MTLPAAAPGYAGSVLIIKMQRCWANRSFRQAGTTGQCPEEVTEADDLGLCHTHVEELRS